MIDYIKLPASGVVAVDPGDKRIGVALFSLTTGNEIWRETMTRGEFQYFVAHTVVPTWVVEDYALDKNRNRGGSKLLTSKVIGWIELRAFQTQSRVVMQPSTNLRLWALHEGIKLPAGHIDDDMSAFLHGSHYLIEQGIRQAKPLVR